jgi:phosphonopyruvate decarboxylase
MVRHQTPYALVMVKGAVEPCDLHSQSLVKSPAISPTSSSHDRAASCTRSEILQAIQASLQPQNVLLATTGYSGRELYAVGDRDNQFYMVGSMGCLSSLALGIAITQPKRQVVVIDGDGAGLMRMGAFATIGYERPANLLHILLDNQIHESTGGQSTVSHSIDFCQIAAACGYERVVSATNPQEVKALLGSPSEQLTFLHVKIASGIPDKLPRLQIPP